MSTQALIDTQKSIEALLNTRMADFEARQKKLADPRAPKSEIETLSREFLEFRTSVGTILQLLQSQIQQVLMRVDELETYNRRNVLLFGGMEEKQGEDLHSAVLAVIQGKLALQMSSSSIVYCHRLGTSNNKRPRVVLVRFTDYQSKAVVWRHKIKLKSSPVVLSEFLTKARQELFVAARKHFGVSRCWSQDGAVLVRLPTDERQRICSLKDLAALTDKFPATHSELSCKPSVVRDKNSVPLSSQGPTTRKKIAATAMKQNRPLS